MQAATEASGPPSPSGKAMAGNTRVRLPHNRLLSLMPQGPARTSPLVAAEERETC